ncbi:type II toxin-antitoxin system VapC family toxin [Luteolibacter sp. SL250]|uniref:type II toxin-antitoxin system VapC family toxin n=1 Tax=Luteolibacter sp. SL250 TaxID=2995170 RepID=UPI00226DA194|nr:type II toxin-antitoxin system VapC family toxin [Luteolibacter sp. SL250]WAC20955.1 type II toxin-antitoxin system VapC family toxin [Luteolibacter sp. SL250]
MKLLVDTQALIWALEGDKRLSRVAREALEDPANRRIVSIATGWEMAIKTGLGKLNPPMPLPHLFPAELERLGFEILPIKSEHVHRLLDLPLHHRDPFDRMLIAQALSENLTMVGCDVAFNAYGAARIW